MQSFVLIICLSFYAVVCSCLLFWQPFHVSLQGRCIKATGDYTSIRTGVWNTVMKLL